MTSTPTPSLVAAVRAAPKGRRTQAERRESAQQRILDAAVKILQDQGFAKATMQEIAREAGVTTGSVQHHFGSKESLVEFVIEAVFRGAAVGGESWPDPTASLDERARQFVQRAWQAIYGRPAYIASWQLHLGVQSSPQLRAVLNGKRERWATETIPLFLACFPEIARGSNAPAAFANLVFSSLRGIGLMALFDGTEVLIEAQLEMLAETIVRAGSAERTSSSSSMPGETSAL
jgi:AcrR family transcriptional regulator